MYVKIVNLRGKSFKNISLHKCTYEWDWATDKASTSPLFEVSLEEQQSLYYNDKKIQCYLIVLAAYMLGSKTFIYIFTSQTIRLLNTSNIYKYIFVYKLTEYTFGPTFVFRIDMCSVYTVK